MTFCGNRGILDLSDIFDKKGAHRVTNERLKAARRERGLSQEELARMVGVSRQTVNMIERGDYNPTLNLCVALCRALGKTLDELFWEG